MIEPVTPSTPNPIAADPVPARIPLPPANTPRTRELRGDAPPDTAGAFTALATYNAQVLARHEQVAKFFSEKGATLALNPTEAVDYQKFIRDHLAYLNMRFVTLGVFTTPSPAPEHGGLAPDPVRDDFVPPEGLDPALARSNAARFAIEHGADLVADNGD